MKHFLVTRFNLRAESWSKSKNGKFVLTETWMQNRFKLFENYCLPSVRNQSNQDFTWVVAFDINTPDNYRKQINDIREGYKNFIPIFIDGNDSLIKEIKAFIDKNIKTEETFVITTRLDNDDIIHVDFIKTIQSMFRPVNKMVIDLSVGYSILLKGIRYNEIRLFENKFNPFISYVEHVNHIKTVFSKKHKEWNNAKIVLRNDSKPLWGELVHDENMLNSTKQHLKRVVNFENTDFGLSKNKIKECVLCILYENILAKIHLCLIRINHGLKRY